MAATPSSPKVSAAPSPRFSAQQQIALAAANPRCHIQEMAQLFLCFALALLWINLVGLTLAGWEISRDYAVSRVLGVLTLCLAFFSLEHWVGLGPQPYFLLPFSTLLSGWLIWRRRALLRVEWETEVFFAGGFFYCLLWRFCFPDIDAISERVGNLAFIEDYLAGGKLPPLDRWFPPYRANFYYSFQHYGAALLGRWLRLTPGLTYHLAYSTLAGLITCAAGSTARRFSAGKTGAWLLLGALILGGSGAAVATHVLQRNAPNLFDSVRFAGGSLAHGDLNAAGLWVRKMTTQAGVEPRDLPMEPLSYLLINGDYHPPLAGMLLLAAACLLVITLETEFGGLTGWRRSLLHALLAATVPLTLIANTWMFPLQAMFVFGWIVYRSCRGECGQWRAAVLGAGAAVLLEFPYLSQFLHQAAGGGARLHWTAEIDHTPWLSWLLIFWPLLGLLVLTFWNRERRAFCVFLTLLAIGLLGFTECFYNDDLYAGTYVRFNTTLKWWPWVYACIVLTVGAANLAARSLFCRAGTICLLLAPCIFGLDLARQFIHSEKPALGDLHGSGWLTRDPIIRDMITALAALPDGVTMESGLNMGNTEAPALALFANKICLLGWPEHQTTWRGNLPEIFSRLKAIDAFYAGTLDDPLAWLARHEVRYILWLPRDNAAADDRFSRIRENISSAYRWHSFHGDDLSLRIGFWERINH